MSSAHRLVEVPAPRLAAWVERFVGRHGQPRLSWVENRLRLASPDDALAELEWPFSAGVAAKAPTAETLDALVKLFTVRTRLADAALIVLVRRGGYAIGLTSAGQLTETKVGRRYVQGTTAAGGWSQKRYARRRAAQTDGLLDAAIDAFSVLARAAEAREARVLITGGDRALIERLLGAAPARPFRDVPRSPLLDVPDPRAATLTDALTRARSVRIRLNDRS